MEGGLLQIRIDSIGQLPHNDTQQLTKRRETPCKPKSCNEKQSNAPGEIRADNAIALQRELTMSSLETTASWVIVRLSDNEVLFETWEPKIVAALKTDLYKAVPIQDWLASINQIKGK